MVLFANEKLNTIINIAQSSTFLLQNLSLPFITIFHHKSSRIALPISAVLALPPKSGVLGALF